MTLAEALLHALAEHGAHRIFGIPGDFALPFFKVVEERGILPLHTLSHEPAVGFAADAAARVSSAPGVAAVTYGAGAFNLVNAIAGACVERSPVVVISGAPSAAERASGLLVHHQAKSLDSQLRVFQEITCEQVRLEDPATAPALIARALRACVERSMPVYIELPRDLAGAPCAPVARLAPSPVDPAAVAACAEAVLARLGQAKAPALMVGVEIRRYGIEAEVAELARRLSLPAVTDFMGRGLLADPSAPLLGTYLGHAGDPAITGLVETADALLLLGVPISDTNFGLAVEAVDLARAIHACDRAVRIGPAHYPEMPLRALVEALLARLPAAAAGAAPPERAAPIRGLVADDAPIEPDDIARAVNDLMARHGPMTMASDIGDCLFTAMAIQVVPLAAPGYYGGMGFGVPAGLGLQAESGERPLILVGDGAFQMTGWELGNCRRYGWDPIVLLFNNRSWEMLRAFQPESAFNDLDDWRFAEMAAGMGGDGERVRSRAELQAALARAHARRGRFQLIEIMLARGAMSATLIRFADGIKAKRARAAAAAAKDG
jgi:indolepyruvate decarboxylase